MFKWKSEEDIIKEILEKTLRYDYMDIIKVSGVYHNCSRLWDMEDGEVTKLIDYDIFVICKVTVDGYDNVIKRYRLE